MSPALVKDVVILVAMQAEAAPMIKRFGLELDENKFPASAPCQCYSGDYKGSKVHLVTNGKCKRFGCDEVGTVSAGLSAWLTLEAFKPDLMINAGTAGGFRRKGAEIGDVFVSSHMRHHDRRVAIPEFEEWAVGHHEAASTKQLQAALGFKHGVVTTGNSLDHTERDREIMEANDASVKDMEAAAVAWACELHGVPLFCIKVVTDIVDGDRPAQDEFLENLGKAAHSLQEAMPKTLDFVIGRDVNDL
ncbi:unnamed protein product [Chrysoparadoxa australica]